MKKKGRIVLRPFFSSESTTAGILHAAAISKIQLRGSNTQCDSYLVTADPAQIMRRLLLRTNSGSFRDRLPSRFK
jgi:hypothetical protein